MVNKLLRINKIIEVQSLIFSWIFFWFFTFFVYFFPTSINQNDFENKDKPRKQQVWKCKIKLEKRSIKIKITQCNLMWVYL